MAPSGSLAAPWPGEGGACCEIQPLQIDQSHTLQVAGPTESELPWGETPAGPTPHKKQQRKTGWRKQACSRLQRDCREAGPRELTDTCSGKRGSPGRALGLAASHGACVATLRAMQVPLWVSCVQGADTEGPL